MWLVQANSTQSEPWTVARLLGWTTEFFKNRQLDAPRLSAEILLAHALECERIELYTRHDAVPGEQARTSFREHVRKAGDGAPIAYLIGYKEFFSARFAVNEHVLIPRPETEMLVERTISLVRGGAERSTAERTSIEDDADGDATERDASETDAERHAGMPGARILEIGTGSGCIAVSLAQHLPDARLFASDIASDALAVARANAEGHGVHERIDFREGDLYAPWEGDEPFDIIVSNPPYIAQTDADSLPANVRDFEPAAALFAGDDGLAVLRGLIAGAPAHLRPGGCLLAEIAYDQAGAVRNLLDASAWGDIVTYRDMAQHERVVHARRLAAGSTQVA